MSEEENTEGESSTNVEPTRKFTQAERIEELNDIDKSISDLLGSAASAMAVLANLSTTGRTDLESHKAAFTEATESYFSTLSNIDVRLRRNVYALEEAGLIPPGDPHRDGKRGAAAAHSDESRTGGNGPLDSSWLNARSSNSVSKAMDQEIWADARSYVERLEVTKPVKLDTGAEDHMEVDEEDASNAAKP